MCIRDRKEAAELQKIMDKEGKGEKLAAWDWWYYAEKLRQEKYDSVSYTHLFQAMLASGCSMLAGRSLYASA